MKLRPLGRSGILVSPVALGCMSLCGNATYDDIPVDQAIATIHAAIDAGINFFDNAPMYGNGEAERRLGLALAGKRRDQIIVADKISSQRMDAPEVVAECEKSLKLLRTDYIDLYQIHWNRRIVPIDETLGAMEKLLASGKVRAIGVCNFGPLDLIDGLEKHQVHTDQVPYNLLWRALEHELGGLCVEHKVGILCYSPLAQGLLSGRYRSADDVPALRARTRHFSQSRPQVRHGERGQEAETFAAIERIGEICRRIGHRMPDVALAWLLHQPGIVSVLAGASAPEQARANLAAAELELSAETLRELDQATRELKRLLGPTIDPWQAESRIR